MNTKVEKYIGWGLTATLAVATFCFFAFAYPGHLYLHEQNQLFLLKWDYVLRGVAAPGGCVDMMGEFLVQFFLFPVLGALILALLVAKVNVIAAFVLEKMSDTKNLLVWSLGGIPAVLALIFLVTDNSIVGGVVALLLAMSLLVGVLSVRNARVRGILGCVGVVLSYWMCGPVSLVYLVGVLVNEIKERNSIFFPVAAVLLAVAAPFMFHVIGSYGLRQYFIGIHYSRQPLEAALMLWYAGLSMCLLIALSVFMKKVGASSLLGLAVAALLAVGAFVGVDKVKNPQIERILMYDNLYNKGEYDKILADSRVASLDDPITSTYRNLCLALKGTLLEDMFKLPQNGLDGLLPSFDGGYFCHLAEAEALLQIGYVSSAHRLFFEAQEAVSDYRRSVRTYKALSQTNIIMGYYAASRKYLDALSHTLFYSKWAKENLELLKDTKTIKDHPVYGKIRSRMPRNFDMLFNREDMTKSFGYLCVENPNNFIAVEYFLAYCLVNGDLTTFASFYNAVSFKEDPRACKEAAAMIPGYNKVTKNMAERYLQFAHDIQEKNPEYIRKTYGDTYWAYYHKMQSRIRKAN